jgi:multicomponent Na+:H+ antiporter subunit F
MSAEGFLDLCIAVTLVLLAVSFALCVFRIVVGPSLPDRILALDMLVILGIGFIATVGIMTEFYLYVDIAIALGLVGFLATVAFARFLLHRGEGDAPRQQSHG